jgi:hypothetical protein
MFGPAMENVSRLETDPAIYFADFDGRRIKFNAKHMTSQALFRETLLNQSGKVLMPMTPVKFFKWIESITQKAVISEAPPETNSDQVVLDHLEEFCLDKWSGRQWDDVIDGAAFDHDGRTYFRPHKFLQSVNKEHRLRYTASEVYQALLKAGVKREQRKIRKKAYALWSVPSFDKPEQKPDGSEM